MKYELLGKEMPVVEMNLKKFNSADFFYKFILKF